MFALEDVSVAYQGRTVLTVSDLSIAGDGVTVLLGHNGSGKSTLMGLLARRARPSRGRVMWNGEPLSSISARTFARAVAYLPQSLPEAPGLSVRDLCGLGRYAWRGALGRWRAADREAVDEALARTGVAAYADQMVDRLSGGERQRAWIAMLLAQDAPMLLLDEPISALDIAHQVEVIALLKALNQEAGRGVLVILHDLNLAARLGDRLLVLKQGRIAFDGPPEALMQRERLRDLFDAPIELAAHPTHPLPVAVTA